MNEILINASTILVLLAGLAGLVGWARRDTLSGPQTDQLPPDVLSQP
jgi:hypothetical protein